MIPLAFFVTPSDVESDRPSSGSTVTWKRRNRQQWRSAAITDASACSNSPVASNSNRYPSECARNSSPGLPDQAAGAPVAH